MRLCWQVVTRFTAASLKCLQMLYVQRLCHLGMYSCDNLLSSNAFIRVFFHFETWSYIGIGIPVDDNPIIIIVAGGRNYTTTFLAITPIRAPSCCQLVIESLEIVACEFVSLSSNDPNIIHTYWHTYMWIIHVMHNYFQNIACINVFHAYLSRLMRKILISNDSNLMEILSKIAFFFKSFRIHYSAFFHSVYLYLHSLDWISQIVDKCEFKYSWIEILQAII